MSFRKMSTRKKFEWKKQSINIANFMIYTVIASIQVELTKDKFNTGYKIYK